MGDEAALLLEAALAGPGEVAVKHYAARGLAVDYQRLLGELYLYKARALAGVHTPCAHGLFQAVERELGGVYICKRARVLAGIGMRIVRGHHRGVLAVRIGQIDELGRIGAGGVPRHARGGVVYLHGGEPLERQRHLERVERPGGVGEYGHAAEGIDGVYGLLRALAAPGGIQLRLARKAYADYVDALVGKHVVVLYAAGQQHVSIHAGRGYLAVVGQREKVVALGAVYLYRLLRSALAVADGGVSVQIALVPIQLFIKQLHCRTPLLGLFAASIAYLC